MDVPLDRPRRQRGRAVPLGLVGLVVSALLAPYLGHGHKTWFVATVSGIFVNFFLNKYWTFKHLN